MRLCWCEMHVEEARSSMPAHFNSKTHRYGGQWLHPALSDSTPAPAGVSLVVRVLAQQEHRSEQCSVSCIPCNEVKATHASISFSFVSAIVYMRRLIDIFSRLYGRAFRLRELVPSSCSMDWTRARLAGSPQRLLKLSNKTTHSSEEVWLRFTLSAKRRYVA